MKNACLDSLAWHHGKMLGKLTKIPTYDKYGSKEADMENACLDGLARSHGIKTEKLTELSIMTNLAQGRHI
jgi:hypothetical protein